MFFAISLAKQKIVKINVLQFLQKSIIYYNYLLQNNTLINKICGNVYQIKLLMTSIFVLNFHFKQLHFYWYHVLLEKFRFIHRLMINILQSKPRGTGIAWWQLLASSIPSVHLWMLFGNKRSLIAALPRGALCAPNGLLLSVLICNK